MTYGNFEVSYASSKFHRAENNILCMCSSIER